MERSSFTSCLSPKKIRDARNNLRVVPCGRCEACMNKRSSRYQRLCELEEKGSFPYCYFVTLTYSDEHLPVYKIERIFDDRYRLLDTCQRSPSYGKYTDLVTIPRKDLYLINRKTTLAENHIGYLHYRDIQLFHKRLRKQIKEIYNEEIRYFVAGEYGPMHLRPHWHAIYFCQSPLHERGKISIFSERNISKIWRKGRVDSDRCKGGANSYTSAYVNSASALPDLYKAVKIASFTKHSIRFGHEAMQELLSDKIDEFILQQDDRRKEISATYSVNGYIKHVPVDATYKDRYLRKPYRFDRFKYDKSLLPYLGAYCHFQREFCDVDAPSVKQLTQCVYDYFTKSSASRLTHYSKQFMELLGISRIVFPGTPDYEMQFNRLYRFLLYSKRFFSCDELERNKRFQRLVDYYDKCDYISLCNQYYTQANYFHANGFDESALNLFYDSTFSLATLRETLDYQQFEANQFNIHNQKLIRKKMNDLANVLNPKK